MKKLIYIATPVILTTLVFYAVYKKQSCIDTACGEALKQLDQRILFYKNDKNSNETLIKLYFEKAYLYQDNEKYNKAYDCYQDAFALMPKTNIDREKFAKIYLTLGEMSYPGRKQDEYYTKCIDLLDGIKSNVAAGIILKVSQITFKEHSEKTLKLLQLASKALPDFNKDSIIAAEIFQFFAMYYSAEKEWQKAAVYARKSFELVKNNDKIKLSFEYILECHTYIDDFYKNQKNIEKRIKNALDAISYMRTKEGNLFFLNKAYDKLGKIYKIAKRYSDAEKSYREIIKICVQNPQKRENSLNLRQEIDAYCEIGDLCLYQKAPKRAIEAFDEASKLLKSKPATKLSQWYFAKVCRNIGDGYFDLGKYELAQKYYKKLLAVLLTEKKKDYRGIAYAYYIMGDIASRNKNSQNSQEYFEKGLRFALIAYEKQKNKHGNNLETGICAAELGTFYDKLKQKDKALKFLQTAHELLEKYGDNQSDLAEKVSQHIKKLTQP